MPVLTVEPASDVDIEPTLWDLVEVDALVPVLLDEFERMLLDLDLGVVPV